MESNISNIKEMIAALILYFGSDFKSHLSLFASFVAEVVSTLSASLKCLFFTLTCLVGKKSFDCVCFVEMLFTFLIQLAKRSLLTRLY
jgi:hypothetical protein